MAQWYRTGTVTVTTGSKNVTGVDTLWLTQAAIGDVFSINGDQLYEIESITTNTALVLKNPFLGASGSSLSYSIIRNFTSSVNAVLASRLTDLLNKWHLREDDMLAWLTGDDKVTLTSVEGLSFEVDAPNSLQKRLRGYLTKVINTADVTLTSVEASNAFFTLTGTLTANRSFIVPADLSHLFLVRNNTTGAYTVTVKTPAGTGVVVPQGAGSALWCDSVNVLGLNSGFIAGTVPDTRGLIAGNGLTGGGNLTTDRTFTLGTPATLTTATTNATTAESHTHAVTFPVTSVASKTGAVTLVKADVGLANVDNTSDLSKVISTATQTALNLKLDNEPTYPTIRPSLNLDFANSQVIDPRIEVTRNSTKSYFDRNGVMRFAAANVLPQEFDPVTGEPKGVSVWEARTNLMQRSEDFANAYWIKGAAGTGVPPVVTPNAAAAPDGTLTADKVKFLRETTSAGNISLLQSGANTVTAIDYTGTIWVKAVRPEDVGREIQFRHVAASQFLTITLTSEWQEAVKVETGVAGSRFIQVGFVSGGTGLDVECYIWGAQLEVGSSPSPYVPSSVSFTSRASTATYFDSLGVMQTADIDVARYGFGLVDGKWISKGLELEAAATNLIVGSEPTAGTGLVSSTTLAGLRSDAIPAAAFGYDGATASWLYKTGAPTETTCTISVFVKMTDGLAPSFGSSTATNVANDFALLVRGVPISPLTYTVAPLANGIYRVRGTVLTATGLDNTGVVKYATNSSRTFTVTGFQLETGTQATSYIPTAGTTVTRSADVSTSAAATRAADVVQMTGENFSEWFNPTEGSVFADSYMTSSSRIVSFDSGDASNRMLLYALNSTTVQLLVQTGGAVQAQVDRNADVGEYNKMSFSYALNDFALVSNASAPVTDTSGSVPPVNRLEIGRNTSLIYLNGHIRSIRYFPQKLSNAELQAITQG